MLFRSVLQTGTRGSALDRRILSEAEKLGLDAADAGDADGEFLVRQVARSVCALVLAAVKPAQRERCLLEDTVCN